MTLTDKDFYFCYDEQLVNYIRFKKGIKYICTGFNVKTKDRFYQFQRTESLNNAIQEYINQKTLSNK